MTDAGFSIFTDSGSFSVYFRACSLLYDTSQLKEIPFLTFYLPHNVQARRSIRCLSFHMSTGDPPGNSKPFNFALDLIPE